MKKLFAGIATAALLIAGAVVAFDAGSAFAQDQPGVTEEAPKVRLTLEEALAELVEESVITQDQADAVAAKLRETVAHRPGFGHVPGLRGLRMFLGALDMTPQEIGEALENGATIAELAEEAGLDVQALIDEAVEAAAARIQTHVDAGRIDAETAAARVAEFEQRITDVVNGDAKFGFRGPRHGRFGPGGSDAPGTGA